MGGGGGGGFQERLPHFRTAAGKQKRGWEVDNSFHIIFTHNNSWQTLERKEGGGGKDETWC